MKKILLTLIVFLSLSAFGYAQPRTPVKPEETKPAAPPAPAPNSFAAKYEGGIFGYSKKEQGTLKFEDVNERIVFYGKDGKEKFAIPYKSMLVIYPQSRSVVSTAGQVVKNIPILGASILGGFIREKRRYLVVNFSDPDVDSKGTTSFKIADMELLDSVIATLAEKAKMKQRGDAYYRPRTDQDDSSN